MLALEGDGEQVGRIGDARQGGEPDGDLLRLPRHAHHRLGVGQAIERGPRDLLRRRVLGDRGELARIVQHLERREAVGIGRALEGAARQIAQHRRRGRLHALVGVARRDRPEGGRPHQLADRRAADARVAILGGDGGEQLLLVERQRLDRCQPDPRVRMFPGRL